MLLEHETHRRPLDRCCSSTLPLTAPVERAPATVSIHSVSATDEIDVSTTRNPYKCVIWRVIDKKKFQKYCK